MGNFSKTPNSLVGLSRLRQGPAHQAQEPGSFLPIAGREGEVFLPGNKPIQGDMFPQLPDFSRPLKLEPQSETKIQSTGLFSWLNRPSESKKEVKAVKPYGSVGKISDSPEYPGDYQPAYQTGGYGSEALSNRFGAVYRQDTNPVGLRRLSQHQADLNESSYPLQAFIGQAEQQHAFENRAIELTVPQNNDMAGSLSEESPLSWVDSLSHQADSIAKTEDSAVEMGHQDLMSLPQNDISHTDLTVDFKHQEFEVENQDIEPPSAHLYPHITDELAIADNEESVGTEVADDIKSNQALEHLWQDHGWSSQPEEAFAPARQTTEPELIPEPEWLKEQMLETIEALPNELFIAPPIEPAMTQPQAIFQVPETTDVQNIYSENNERERGQWSALSFKLRDAMHELVEQLMLPEADLNDVERRLDALQGIAGIYQRVRPSA